MASTKDYSKMFHGGETCDIIGMVGFSPVDDRMIFVEMDEYEEHPVCERTSPAYWEEQVADNPHVWYLV